MVRKIWSTIVLAVGLVMTGATPLLAQHHGGGGGHGGGFGGHGFGGGHGFNGGNAFNGGQFHGGPVYRGPHYYRYPGGGIYFGYGSPYPYYYNQGCGYYDQWGYWHPDPGCYNYPY